MREWRDLVRQLTDLSKHLGLDIESDNGGPDALHRALLTGLLARIGHLDPETNGYRGAHALRFALHPSSVLGKRRSSARPPRQSGNKALGQSNNSPEWIVAGELVDTSRLFARNAAEIDVRWIEPLAGDIAKHSYRSPEWDAENGFVRATEQVTLYGLVIVPARRRDYSRIDPTLSRQMFLLHGLAMGEFPHPPPLVRENAALIGEIKKRAERLRRPELFDANALVQHFDEAIPREIVSTRDLVKWLRVATDEEKSRFRLDKRQWLPKVGVSSAAFPDSIRIGGVKLALSALERRLARARGTPRKARVPSRRPSVFAAARRLADLRHGGNYRPAPLSGGKAARRRSARSPQNAHSSDTASRTKTAKSWRRRATSTRPLPPQASAGEAQAHRRRTTTRSTRTGTSGRSPKSRRIRRQGGRSRTIPRFQTKATA